MTLIINPLYLFLKNFQEKKTILLFKLKINVYFHSMNNILANSIVKRSIQVIRVNNYYDVLANVPYFTVKKFIAYKHIKEKNLFKYQDICSIYYIYINYFEYIMCITEKGDFYILYRNKELNVEGWFIDTFIPNIRTVLKLNLYDFVSNKIEVYTIVVTKSKYSYIMTNDQTFIIRFKTRLLKSFRLKDHF